MMAPVEQSVAVRGPGQRFSIDLPVRNEWRNIERLRTLVQRCSQAACASGELGETLAMVTGELLENALKYGAGARVDAIRLLVSGDLEDVRITVKNPIQLLPGASAADAAPAAVDDAPLAELLRTIAWIESFDTPADAYRARLLEIASCGDDWERASGKLGLLRVAYEGSCALSARIDAGILSVTARMRL